MRLVDDDGVPVHVVEVLAEAAHVLQRVDGDDDPLVVRERVAASRDLPLDSLDADRVQADERDREPRPQFQLELLKDLLRGDDEDAVAASPSDELGEDEADLQGLAESHDVREEDARPQVLEGEFGGALLVGERVEKEAVGHRETALGLRERGAAQRGFQVQPGQGERGRLVAEEHGLAGVEEDRLRVFERGKEDGALLADELAHAGRGDLVAGVRGLRTVAHQPLGAADLDPRAWRERRRCLLVVGVGRAHQSLGSLNIVCWP